MRFARIKSAAIAIGIAAVAQASAAGSAQAALASPVHHTALGARQAVGFHLPYSDPNQAGWLTLCGLNLKPITHGSINTKPFVWRVVSDLPAPKGYFRTGAKAQLFAYQPRPYTPAGAWSGTIMAAPSYYSNRSHPMAQFTPIDEPLSYMTIAYPPIWDHLIQLRLYLGAPNTPEDTTGYAAADIQVIGNTWTLVAGGNSSCTAGRVVSEETVVGMPGASGTPKPSQPGSSAGATNSAGASPGASSHPSTATVASAADTSNSIGSGLLMALAVVVLVAAAAAFGIMWRRRQRRATG